MKFRTELHIAESQKKIHLEDKIFSIGSCFASEIANLLGKGQLQTLENPFGTLFNPFSIANAVYRLHQSAFYNENDLITYQDTAISLDHHSSFDTRYAHKTLDKINRNIEQGNLFLQETNWVIVTYGTAFIYEFLPQNRKVANCHKIPGKFFNKRLLTLEELRQSIQDTIECLQDICREDVQILFTVSPVRHTKEGMVENNLSKALLITAVHESVRKFQNCHYLPVYEIMMDDLRDYRFYKEDMIHPSSQAVDYVFQKFSKAYAEPSTLLFMQENFRIHQALSHKPHDAESTNYQKFLQRIDEKIKQQQAQVKHRIFTSER